MTLLGFANLMRAEHGDTEPGGREHPAHWLGPASGATIGLDEYGGLPHDHRYILLPGYYWLGAHAVGRVNDTLPRPGDADAEKGRPSMT